MAVFFQQTRSSSLLPCTQVNCEIQITVERAQSNWLFRWRVQQNETDTYDARQRPWFAQSLSSSKDLLIMLDM